MERVLIAGDSLTLDVAVTQVAGAVMSMVSCLFVITTYLLFTPLKRDPNGLIFWMSMFSLGFNIIYLAGVGAHDELGCDKTGPFSQFFLLGTELYLMCLAADLHFKTRNPFQTEFKQTMGYHTFVWTVSGISGAILWASGKTGKSALGFCWIQSDGVFSTDAGFNIWSYCLLVFPIVTIYLFIVCNFLYVQRRLKKGLPESFLARQHVLSLLKLYVKAFSLYWSLIVVLFIILKSLPPCTACWSIFQFIVGAKSLVNAILWARGNEIKNAFEGWRKNDWDRAMQKDSINKALRTEVIQYTTEGIVRSITQLEDESKSDSTSNPASRYFLLSPGSDTTTEVEFRDLLPLEFSQIRQHFGISNKKLLNSFRGNASERYSEGKSGAFLYFTGDSRFIVKTCTESELNYLLSFLPKYREHIELYPETMLVRILGAYELIMYHKTVRFICQQTVFDTDLSIHERYDLKGSWVGRIDRSNEPGSRVVCQYCGARYIVGMSKSTCPNQPPGHRHCHETVAKDLNWGGRHLNIESSYADRVLMQLHSDSIFLKNISSLDYSLLIGIHFRMFDVPKELDYVEAPVAPASCTSMSSSAGSQVRHRVARVAAVNLSALDVGKSSSFAAGGKHSTAKACGLHAISPTSTEAGIPLRPFFRSTKGGIRVNVVRGPGIYFMGVIDILTKWTWKKALEHYIRVYILQQNSQGISCVHPDVYAKRFQTNVIEELVLTERERLNGQRRNTLNSNALGKFKFRGSSPHSPTSSLGSSQVMLRSPRPCRVTASSDRSSGPDFPAEANKEIDTHEWLSPAMSPSPTASPKALEYSKLWRAEIV